MYQNVIYSSGGKADFSGAIMQVFIGTWFSRNLPKIWCSVIKNSQRIMMWLLKSRWLLVPVLLAWHWKWPTCDWTVWLVALFFFYLTCDFWFMRVCGCFSSIFPFLSNNFKSFTNGLVFFCFCDLNTHLKCSFPLHLLTPFLL